MQLLEYSGTCKEDVNEFHTEAEAIESGPLTFFSMLSRS